MCLCYLSKTSKQTLLTPKWREGRKHIHLQTCSQKHKNVVSAQQLKIVKRNSIQCPLMWASQAWERLPISPLPSVTVTSPRQCTCR